MWLCSLPEVCPFNQGRRSETRRYLNLGRVMVVYPPCGRDGSCGNKNHALCFVSMYDKNAFQEDWEEHSQHHYFNFGGPAQERREAEKQIERVRERKERGQNKCEAKEKRQEGEEKRREDERKKWRKWKQKRKNRREKDKGEGEEQRRRRGKERRKEEGKEGSREREGQQN